MAETTLLRQSAIVRNGSIGTSPPSAPRGAVKTGELPLVQVKMGPGGPQVLTPPQKPVEILPPRDADSAVRTGGLPMVCVKMTSQGPQLDDGQDNRGVVILPPKDQKHALAAGGLPMVQVKMSQGGPQVQNLPQVQSARPPVQGPPPALSQPRGVRQAQVVRVAAPQQVPLPPVPELTTDQLMLCRHLVGKYLAELRSSDLAGQVVPEASDSEAGTAVEGVTTPKEGADNIGLAEATVDMIDQTLVAVAVRAEALASAELAAEASPVAPTAPAAPAVSIIPAAPTASYVAGRVGGRTTYGGRVQRNASMAPRRVARTGAVPPTGALPPVIVKMENGRSVVQNQAEVAAARAAVLARPTASEGDSSGAVDSSTQS